MKINSFIVVAIFCINLISCYDLELKPKDLIDEAALFGSEAGVKRYFTGLYGWLPIEDFLYGTDGNSWRNYRKYSGNDLDGWGTWEAQKQMLQNMCGEFVNSWTQVRNDAQEYWPYDRIRDVNLFINNFPNYEKNYDAETYRNLLGEAHFFRAFMYSGLAKRYGGMPIITEVQDPLGDEELLYVTRSTEYEMWKFIYEDLKFAIENMTEEKNISRASKYTAAALMSRTMLYAGRIAKYTKYLGHDDREAYINKLVGIDETYADEFFNYSLEASKLVAEEGGYSLYLAEPKDLAKNFADLFLDPGSSETIFVKAYMEVHDPRNTWLIEHNWDALMLPVPSMSSFVGSQGYPALDMMRLYELPDNWIADENGMPTKFDKRGDIRNGVEPRMLGSMFFNGDEHRGVTFEIQRGIYKKLDAVSDIGADDDAIGAASDNRIRSKDRAATIEVGGKSVRILSEHGTRHQEGGENNCLTGAYVRKYINPNMTRPVKEHESTQPWIAFRLAEVYLNLAEAAYELGDRETAAEYIKLIRERAGCKNTGMPENMTETTYTEFQYLYPIETGLQFIRDERYRELWGENHRWWDLITWRTATEVLFEWSPRTLSCYYVVADDKYVYIDEKEMNNRRWTAAKRCYYLEIPAGQINRNPNLRPNNPLRAGY